MDDNEHVCPICCEDLDISDRQFFPCKCGYQVCMWCWHRIRESESGLCPACRTPYGDDPHAFSAVDVDEVLKANKEKEAAAKREKDRLKQSDNNGTNTSEADTIAALSNGKVGQMEVPRDRSVLADMRVIRRNLVYAVGLGATISNEEILRKAEYFGQYGRISKIVLNRSQTTATGDTRRATASAYVTFVHKEDTLSCILALDGFYIDGRNIRASYGTSKYCSAFIRNVRCNNPECTYLHEMGYIEDTFTKQEIQAGYVTSGRDVLARQQQIMAQALASLSGNGTAPRRKTGGGGPSGTGRASASPVFPPPTFDEQQKPPLALVPPPPSAAALGRSVTTGPGFPPIAANAAVAQSGPPAGISSTKLVRSSSAGANVGTAAAVPAPSTNNKKQPVTVAAATPAAPTPAAAAPVPAPVPDTSTTPAASANAPAPSGATAASVVAGVHSISGSSYPPAPHTTLTPLTPLKRSTVAKAPAKTQPVGSFELENSTKLTSLRSTANKKNSMRAAPASSSPPNATHDKMPQLERGPSLIGGTVIAAPTSSVPITPMIAPNRIHTHQHQPTSNIPASNRGDGLGGLGGEVFTGSLNNTATQSIVGNSAVGGKDKWNAAPIGGDVVFAPNNGGFWSNDHRPVGGNTIGMPNGSGGLIGSAAPGNNGTGSSALASMLGINLPSGSGTLRDTTELWGGVSVGGPKPFRLTALNGTSVPMQGMDGSSITRSNNDGLIGGVTIGTQAVGTPSALGGENKSDIALLQSLLPGVHITSGHPKQPGFGTIGGNGWNNTSQRSQRTNDGLHGGVGLQGGQWNGGREASVVGAIGQSAVKQQQRQGPGSIW